MKQRRWAAVLALLLVLSLGLLGGCEDAGQTLPEKRAEEEEGPVLTKKEKQEISDEAAADLFAGVVLGQDVCLGQNGVAFWGAGGHMCSALLDENGGLFDPVVEASPNLNMYSFAIDRDICYVATEAGFMQFSLTDFANGEAPLHLISEALILDGFSIYDGTVYYSDGGELRRFSLADGEAEGIIAAMADYAVTNRGIYFVDGYYGGFSLFGYDGTVEQLLPVPEGTHFSLWGEDVFFWYGGDEVLRWDLNGGATECFHLLRSMDSAEDVWVMEDSFLYTDEEGMVYNYDLATGEESEREMLFVLPEKNDGTVSGHMLYYRYDETVYWDDMRGLGSGSLSLSDFYSGAGDTEDIMADAATGATAEEGPDITYHIDSDLNVYTEQGVRWLETGHFRLSLPVEPEWDYEVIDENTIAFYYPPARDAGYDGGFLTIRAYDWGDNGYGELPSYSVAGLDEDKKYIAIFPTDVRFDTADARQREEYAVLLDTAFRMDTQEHPTDNPFEVWVD